jgi:hypothetical protein
MRHHKCGCVLLCVPRQVAKVLPARYITLQETGPPVRPAQSWYGHPGQPWYAHRSPYKTGQHTRALNRTELHHVKHAGHYSHTPLAS